MKIKATREILNDVYSTTVAPVEFGTSTDSMETELEMLKDTPQVLRYADIDFSAKFKIADGLPVISEDEDAVEVTLDLTNKEFVLDENFSVTLSVDCNKILPAELDETVFTDKHLLAQAKVILFDTLVIKRMKELLDIARGYKNTFEDTVEQTI